MIQNDFFVQFRSYADALKISSTNIMLHEQELTSSKMINKNYDV